MDRDKVGILNGESDQICNKMIGLEAGTAHSSKARFPDLGAQRAELQAE